MPDWFDFTPDLKEQTLPARILLWPCHSAVACSNAFVNCDACGAAKILFCCPCRTCCAWCPTEAELKKHAVSESGDIPYTKVFEMEKKRRDLISAQTH